MRPIRKPAQAPTLAVVGLVAVGLLFATTVSWDYGTTLIGLALLLAAGLRLTLPVRTAGWLVVRSRGFDAAVLLVLGFGLLVLTTSIPEP